jgi:hypothetical protein
MAKKKITNKITTAPSGVSFMYAEREPYGPMPHAWARKPAHRCKKGGTIHVIGPAINPHVNRPDALIYGCDACKWTSPSGNFHHDPTEPTEHHVETGTIKKQNSKKQTKEFIAAFRAEYRKQMRVLAKERAKFPPSLIESKKRVKGKSVKVWKINPKFTDAMREHMHTFAVDSEQIADEIVLSGVQRFVVARKKHAPTS